MKFRVFIGLFLLISLFLFPWWLTIAIVIVGNLKISYWFESIFAGIFLDSFYGSHFTWSYFPYFFSIIILIFILLSSKIHKEMI